MEKLVNVKEIAGILGLTEKTVRSKYKRLGLPYYKVGWLIRFRVSEIEDWLQKRHKEKHMQMPKLVKKIL